MKELDGKHQRIQLNHWHHSFFKLVQIKSRRVSQSQKVNDLLRSAFFTVWAEFILNQPLLNMLSINHLPLLSMLYQKIRTLPSFIPKNSSAPFSMCLFWLFTPQSGSNKVINTSSRCQAKICQDFV